MRTHARSDGAIEFLPALVRISQTQVQILVFLDAQPAGRAYHHRLLHQVLWPGQLHPLSGSQRASLSRSLSRMERAGWVQRIAPTYVQLGERGAALARWLRGWGSWAAYEANWGPLPTSAPATSLSAFLSNRSGATPDTSDSSDTDSAGVRLTFLRSSAGVAHLEEPFGGRRG